MNFKNRLPNHYLLKLFTFIAQIKHNRDYNTKMVKNCKKGEKTIATQNGFCRL